MKRDIITIAQFCPNCADDCTVRFDIIFDSIISDPEIESLNRAIADLDD